MQTETAGASWEDAMHGQLLQRKSLSKKALGKVPVLRLHEIMQWRPQHYTLDKTLSDCETLCAAATRYGAK
jgi:hypothetical protein